jgi:hypothetical protein
MKWLQQPEINKEKEVLKTISAHLKKECAAQLGGAFLSATSKSV